jgi:hypothetical protein
VKRLVKRTSEMRKTMNTALCSMIVNALQWTTLSNLLEGVAYAEALEVVNHVFGPDSDERAELDRYFNVI